eukprot:CAMPEP_0204431424 /NCGR_PEP_ID=MMETSP0470-20130426/64882_1 /ASSEMBLY_ACC=CAM_ASM_000385 /TAXON_ID=2969 /ORGANISM="Oxyrrhis marina" /LENGTH=75 /DNA_ID=CAMNT_0051429627 /DNA_START=80 /DNA_END=304 /DNA_ORIENTATION=-
MVGGIWGWLTVKSHLPAGQIITQMLKVVLMLVLSNKSAGHWVDTNPLQIREPRQYKTGSLTGTAANFDDSGTRIV